MAGILDKKSRFIDYKLTVNGRTQLTYDDLRFKFASFSDKSIIYEKDDVKSLSNKANIDGSEKYFLPLEVTTNDSDTISNEFKFDSAKNTYNDVYLISDTNKIVDGITSDEIIDLSKNKINEISIGENIKSQNIILKKSSITPELLGFKIQTNTGNNAFDFLNTNVVNSYPTIVNENSDIKSIASIYFDKRFESKNNFLKIPPINKDGSKVFEDRIFEFSKVKKVKSSIDFLFKAYSERITLDDENNRDKTLKNIVDSLSLSERIFKKEYFLNEEDDKDTFILELFEISDTPDFINSTLEIEKLLFIKVGDVYDNLKSTYKTVYMAGKVLYNDRLSEIPEEIQYFIRNENIDIQGLHAENPDVLTNRMFGTPNNYESKIFKLSALYSFLNMFIIVAE
jgi:hypothetical protein